MLGGGGGGVGGGAGGGKVSRASVRHSWLLDDGSGTETELQDLSHTTREETDTSFRLGSSISRNSSGGPGGNGRFTRYF